jgi:ribonuclease HII
MSKKQKLFTVGIDEAGRGPLAGPLSLACVVIKSPTGPNLKGLRDSKQLSEEKREEWYKKILKWKKERKIDFAHIFVSHEIIDKKGMSFSLRNAVKKTLKKLPIKSALVKVLLDGSLYAPSEYVQKTIIKGDEKIRSIMLASIIAKVRRDRLMRKISVKFPAYGFEIHKGYGTRHHRQMVLKYGPSAIHRLSFLTKIAPKTRTK